MKEVLYYFARVEVAVSQKTLYCITSTGLQAEAKLTVGSLMHHMKTDCKEICIDSTYV